MIAEQSVDVVIVTAPDHAHAELVARALAAGADVVVEKPLTIDRARLPADHGRGRRDRPRRRHDVQLPLRPAELLPAPGHRVRRDRRGHLACTSSGRSTPCTAPTTSAAGTARRRTPAACWCTSRATTSTWSTGGSSDVPARVYARGGLQVLRRPQRRRPRARRPTGPRAPASSATPSRSTCTADPRLKSLYLDAEEHDGYLRDQDVFGPGITIEDNLALARRLPARRHPDLLAERAQPVGGLPRHRQRHGRPRGARGRRARRDRAGRGRQRAARPVGHPDLARRRAAPRGGAAAGAEALGARRPSTRSPTASAGTAAATRSCSRTCSDGTCGSPRTRSAARPGTSTGCGPCRSASRPTSRWSRACR